eukprot:PhM_4_TR17994/c0_g1_i1/m.23986
MKSYVSHDLQELHILLQELRYKPEADAFNYPVSVHVPFYYRHVKHPMDLGTINTRLWHGTYRTVEEVLEDVKRVWDNCYDYNDDGAAIARQAKQVQKWWESKVDAWQKLRKTKETPAIRHSKEGDWSIEERKSLGERIARLSEKDLRVHVIPVIMSAQRSSSKVSFVRHRDPDEVVVDFLKLDKKILQTLQDNIKSLKM